MFRKFGSKTGDCFMTIKEYYDNYKINKKYPVKLQSGNDRTIDDFYQNSISKHRLDIPKERIIAWHKMFVEYTNRSDAIFWIRNYENGSKASGAYDTRRGCLTTFADGFSYVFVSNYEVHEIFNMIRLNVEPSINEFADLMLKREFHFHYCKDKSCVESQINCYPSIGSVHCGILTPNYFYLAHIYGVKDYEYLRGNNSTFMFDTHSPESERIMPRGLVSDWTDKTGIIGKSRLINKKLSIEEKNLIKAHFLRLVDPLNYYVVPGPCHEKNAFFGEKKVSIGEFDHLNKFMARKYEQIYGKAVMDEFRKLALIKDRDMGSYGLEQIDIEYSPLTLKERKSSKTDNSGSLGGIQQSNVTIKPKGTSVKKIKRTKSSGKKDGKDMLDSMGRAFFVCYYYYEHIDHSFMAWKTKQIEKTLNARIGNYKASEQFHRTYLQSIVDSSRPGKLSTNTMGKSGDEIISLAKKSLEN